MDPLLATREEAERNEHEQLGPLACFSDAHGDRPEPEEPDPFRPCFVRDRDRVLHCGAFRRLKDKTQVFVIDEGDFYRTRLTHTLEVAQMARFICRALRLNDTLTEVLALAHDIGHPPFGHEGEVVLDERSGVGFDHNRQGLRIVDVLEAPYHDRQGLNLSQVVRRSILKHGGDAGRGAPTWTGALLEAQAADLADSTAYLHHDLEDALRAGILEVEALADLPVWRRAAASVSRNVRRAHRIKAVLNDLLKTSLRDILASSADAIAASDVTTAEQAARMDERLVRMSPARAEEHAALRAFLHENFYRHPRVLRSAQLAREAIEIIVDHYNLHVDELPGAYRDRVEGEGLGRTVCDYVAGMTDTFAREEGRRLADLRPAAVLLEDDDRVARLELVIHYRFKRHDLATTALTHASARNDSQHPNERLEFLGDAVLGMIVARRLYERFPERAEGELSRIKSAVVSRHALRKVAKQWNLVEMLSLGPGILSTGDVPASVVADAVEAVLGAVFLDGGEAAVTRLVEHAFGPLIDASADRQRATNHKSELQHWTQGRLGYTPHYRVLSEEGPDHEKQFTVAAIVNGEELAVATGKNKRQAEQRAAREALGRLKEGNDG